VKVGFEDSTFRGYYWISGKCADDIFCIQKLTQVTEKTQFLQGNNAEGKPIPVLASYNFKFIEIVVFNNSIYYGCT
jgi:hypothetical protein